jgi:hypothetical protein
LNSSTGTDEDPWWAVAEWRTICKSHRERQLHTRSGAAEGRGRHAGVSADDVFVGTPVPVQHLCGDGPQSRVLDLKAHDQPVLGASTELQSGNLQHLSMWAGAGWS